MQVDSLELQIKTNAESAANSIAKLRDSLKGIRSACTSYAKGLEKVNEALKTLNTSVSTATSNNLSSLSDKFVKIESTTADLSEALVDVKDKIKEVGVKGANSSKGLSVFFKQLKRIAVYRLIRTALKIISNLLKEGLENVAKYDSAMGNIYGYNQSLSALQSKWTQLKNTMGVFAANIVQVLTPVLIGLMQIVMELVEAFNALWAFLSGKDSYLAANEDYWSDYAKSLDDSNDSAKALKKTLFGFDELNVLNGESGTSSATDVTDMFKEVQISDAADRMSELYYWYDKFMNTPSGDAGIEGVKLGIKTLVKVFEEAKSVLEGNPIKIPTPNLVLDPVYETMGAFVTDVEEWFGKIQNSAKIYFADVVATISDAFSTAKSDVADFCEKATTEIDDYCTTTYDRISEWSTGVKDKVSSAFANAKENVATFCTTTASNIAKWASNVGSNISSAVTSFATNLYNGFQNVCTNIAKFVTSTSANIANWCTNLVTNISSAVNKFVQNFLSGLKTAWESFKSWCSATGSKLSGFYQENKTTILTSAAFAGVAAIAAALVPFTGGASLGLLALANGGSVDTGSLFLAGEAGPELVTQVGGRSTVYNEEQLGSSLAYANEGVISAINTLIGVVRNKSNNVTISASDIRKAVNSSSMRVGV